MLQGVRFKQAMKLQEYNYGTGEVEPIDLSESEIRLRIYKPKHILELQAKNEQTGEVIKREIHLTDEQNKKLEELDTEEERRMFLSGLVREQGITDEIIEEIKQSTRRKKHNNPLGSTR
ncbi:unnamed protein product [marine sediment metagenome]|uniref:Uncharacterized protein n=1 Tax=marine sediment metagenome TaxID=412755 RepID=X0VKI0_9ZZZZ